ELEKVSRQAGRSEGALDDVDEALCRVEVSSRDVHCDPRRWKAGVEPALRLPAGFVEDPRVDLDYEPGFLGERHELVRSEQAENRVLPANECFDANDLGRPEI